MNMPINSRFGIGSRENPVNNRPALIPLELAEQDIDVLLTDIP